MVEQNNQEIYRGWLIITGVAVGDRHTLAELIYEELGTDHGREFVVRADTIRDGSLSNDIGLVVPMCAETIEDLEDLAAEKAGEYDYYLAIVDQHVPDFPHRAPGWVTAEEAENPSQGPTGLNPW